MSIQVKSIDVYAIEEKLKKDKDLKDIWDYVKSLKNIYEGQKELSAKAISKIKEQAARIQELEKQISNEAAR